MNPFTSLCLLCTFGKEEKKHNSWGAGAKASTSLSRATFFQLFKTSHAKRPGSQLWQDAGEREKTERGDKTKHKNSNICSRFQPDSLMWITQHFVPWPWRTKGRGGCLRSEVRRPGRRASSEHPCSFRWVGLIVLRRGREVPLGHPGTACHLDCHSFSTEVAAWQMKLSGAWIKCNFQSGSPPRSPCHMNADQGQANNYRSAFKATGKCRDKSVQGGLDEYLSILAEDANIHTDLFHLSPKLEKGKFLPIESKRNTTKQLCTSRLKSYKFLILLKSTRDLWSPWQWQGIQPSDCLQWISDKTKWKWIDVILMQKWALKGRSTRFIFE